jgi:hypothetical protein
MATDAMIARIVRAAARGVAWLVMTPVRKLFLVHVRSRAPRTVHDELTIATWDRGSDHATLERRVRDALDLIRQVDPRRYARLKRDVHRITLERLQVAGMFVPNAGRVFLDVGHVAQAHVAELASTVVHEATHARLHRAGIRHDSRIRGRVEHACIRSEVDFAVRLGPEYVSLVEAVTQKYSSVYWSDDARFDRRTRELKSAGLPAWFVRTHTALFRP